MPLFAGLTLVNQLTFDLSPSFICLVVGLQTSFSWVLWVCPEVKDNKVDVCFFFFLVPCDQNLMSGCLNLLTKQIESTLMRR